MSIQSLNGTPGGAIPQSSPPAVGSGAPAAASISVPTPTPAQPSTQQPTAQQLQEAIKAMESVIQPKASALQFSVDSESGSTVVKIVDGQTGDVIRQIPSEEVIRIAQSIDQFQGILGKIKA
ncbi:MAG: flagellar protein FlaG [Rhodocyclaceae bacterium]|nr:flagellar protein FlaG [Rhodocyclaceae bacterium]